MLGSFSYCSRNYEISILVCGRNLLYRNFKFSALGLEVLFRSLQPRGLAETLCGSPLYMAPEIMQLQKSLECWCNFISACYRKNTFYRKQSIQLLQNIMKSNELQFPSDNLDLSSDCKDLCKKLLHHNPGC
ncbi:hypothetical protein L6164_005686 [Bauhinia variegata]|uniref:Uncharacterized protein n=1 Tax=Bauhinia variegata TaxID=167791 RepID=A0ACB9PS35_BAUVA|nr:hypothetical protein L6164_005686 [Bauhinia variegata]